MNINITIPAIGESISEGTIARWLKKDGDQVAQGEPLFELETDKATTEIPAPNAGVLHIRVAEGQTVAVGATIGTLGTNAQGNGSKKTVETRRPTEDTDKGRRELPSGKAKASGTQRNRAAPQPAEKERTRPPGQQDELPEAPAVPPLAKGSLESPGPPKEQRESQASAPEKEEQPHEKDRREPMSPIRLRIAQRLLAAQQGTASLTTFNEADLADLENLRARCQQRFQEKHGVNLGLMSFFVKACTAALKEHPIINARIDGSDIVYHRHCNIGVAVSTDKGLFVPVLRQAERMTFAQIEKTTAELAARARKGDISIHDLQDGTFTITNGGVFGSLLSTPLLNPPQSAILGLHAIQNRPVAAGDQVVIRPMMYLALSYDHRLIDGRDAVQFLVRVKESVEKPETLLLEM